VDPAQQSVHIVAASVGFTSLALLWLTVVAGLVLRNGWAMTRMKHQTLYGMHQTPALLGLTLGIVHALAQLAAPGGTVRLIDEFVPFGNSVDPVGIGVGVVGLEIMTAAALSVLVQKKMGYTRWRGLHALTYVAFTLVVGHVLISGSDVGPSWVWGTVLVMWLITVVLWMSTTQRLARFRGAVNDRVRTRQRGQQLTIGVDAQKCARFGFCEQEAPDVFTLRSDGRLAYRAVVGGGEVDAVMRAVAVCPARAITLTRDATSVLTPKPEEPPQGDDHRPTATVTGLHRRSGGRR